MMKNLLKDLEATKVLKITGSFADGTQNDDSDIDFYVKPDHPDKWVQGTRNIQKVIAVLKKHGIEWDSTEVGYIFTHRSRNRDLEIDLEFSDRFEHRPNRKKEVQVYGVTFKTY